MTPCAAGKGPKAAHHLDPDSAQAITPDKGPQACEPEHLLTKLSRPLAARHTQPLRSGQVLQTDRPSGTYRLSGGVDTRKRVMTGIASHGDGGCDVSGSAVCELVGASVRAVRLRPSSTELPGQERRDIQLKKRERIHPSAAFLVCSGPPRAV